MLIKHYSMEVTTSLSLVFSFFHSLFEIEYVQKNIWRVFYFELYNLFFQALKHNLNVREVDI